MHVSARFCEKNKLAVDMPEITHKKYCKYNAVSRCRTVKHHLKNYELIYNFLVC